METLHGFKRSKERTRPLGGAARQARQTQVKPGKRLEGSQAVKRVVASVREALQVAAQALPRAARSGTSTSRPSLRSAPAALGGAPVVPPSPGSTDEAVGYPLQAEPEWPRLPDETGGQPQPARSGVDRWPSLPESVWDPRARLSPSEALRVASEERRNTLRLRRRDLEQRGELWNA